MSGKIIEQFYEELSPYIDFELLDCLNSYPNEPEKEYHVYLAELREEHLVLMPERSSIVLRELSDAQFFVYKTIASNWNPYLETVFGVLGENSSHNGYLAVNEFIPRPSFLDYRSLPPDLAINTRSLTLEQYIRSFGCLAEKDALVFLYQLCDGLSVLHRNHLVHGDISPRNILLTDRFAWDDIFDHLPGIHQRISVKLIDFDITKARKAANHTVTNVVGTLPYAAPEIVDFTIPTDRVDIYSLGCILFFMLTGRSPKDADGKQLSKLCSKGTFHIFIDCTANYELRYRNLKQLKKAIERELCYPDKCFYRIIHHVPGFRSGQPINMALCILGLGISSYFICELAQETAAPSKAFLCGMLILLFSIIAWFDVFQIGRFSKKYQQARRLFPPLRYLVRFILIYSIVAVMCAAYFSF